MTTLREHLNQNLSGMDLEFSSWKQHYRDINDYIMPRTSRFFVTDRNRGDRRNPKINNNTATMALRMLRSGLMSGVTNPASMWFKFRTEDPALNKWRNAKVYLDLVQTTMAEIFLRSNLYTTLPLTYQDMGGYGTNAFELLEDPITTIRCYSWPVGSYMLALDDRLAVGTGYRRFQMTARQLVGQFGLDNCTQGVKDAWNRGDYNRWFTVHHAVEKNPDAITNPLYSKDKAYRSIYWELGSRDDQYLRQSGHDSFQLVAPRWDVLGEDVYGNSPGMEALGDVMALQLEQRRKMTVIDKHTNPPTSAPVSLEKKGISNLPGGVTYVDVMSGGQGIVPNYQTDLRGMQYLLEDIRDVEQRIDTAFYKDLFLLVTQLDREATAYEIAARKEEKLLALGPVYLRLNDELLDVVVNRTLQIMLKQSVPYWEGKLNGSPLLPPPPPELMGAPLAIEYTSIMNQAMKAVGIQSIERTLTFAGSLQQSFPEILDNLNGDRAIQAYGDLSGTPADLYNDEQQVAAIRQQRQQREQAQQAAALAQQGATAAKDLAAAKLGDNNALSQLMGRLSTPASQGA